MKLQNYLLESSLKEMFTRLAEKVRSLGTSSAERTMKKNFDIFCDKYKGTEHEKRILQSVNRILGSNWTSLEQIRQAKVPDREYIKEDLAHYWKEIREQGLPALLFYPALQVFMEVDKIIRGLPFSETVITFYSTLWITLVSLSYVSKWKKWKKESPEEFEKEGSKKNPFAIPNKKVDEAVIEPNVEPLVKKTLNTVLSKLRKIYSRMPPLESSEDAMEVMKIAMREFNLSFSKYNIVFLPGESGGGKDIFLGGKLLTTKFSKGTLDYEFDLNLKPGTIIMEFDPTLFYYYAYHCSLRQSEDADKLERELILMLSHEMIHRIQMNRRDVSMNKRDAVADKPYGISFKGDPDDMLKGFTKQEEVMAYAYTLVKDLEQQGYDRNFIKRAFQKGSDSQEFRAIRKNRLLYVYLSMLKRSDDPKITGARKRFLKVLYQYLEKGK